VSDVHGELTAFFRETLSVDVGGDGDDLIESSRLDSLGLVELLFFLEQRFGVRVDVEQLDLNDFRSVEAICRMVERARPS
jgi:methoxymalonate biosynthesis acyl carrier protein